MFTLQTKKKTVLIPGQPKSPDYHMAKVICAKTELHHYELVFLHKNKTVTEIGKLTRPDEIKKIETALLIDFYTN